MKLRYNVLCIDDKISSLKKTKKAFSDFNLKVGIEVRYVDIEVNIGAREKPKDFKEKILKKLSNSFSDNIFELIIVDLHMTGGMDGESIITAIRETHTLYRPIIFYSAGDPASHENAQKQLNAAAKKIGVLGNSIFITTRDKLLTFLKEIAKEMHIEEHKINQVRGLLMDGVSELDAKIIDAIKLDKLWDAVPANKHNKVIKEFKERIKDKFDKSKELWEAIDSLSYQDIKKLITTDPKKIETFTKGKVLREILRHIANMESQGTILSGFLHGNSSLTSIRNSYAHEKASELQKGHTVAKCVTIRKETRKQLKNIDKVLKRK